jgi:hypothetical protein
LQAKLEKRFSKGIWMLASYTWAKNITDADSAQSATSFWSGNAGVISPFEQKRNKGLALDDVPHILAVSVTYQLPIGPGKAMLNQGGVIGKLLGGWQATSIFRAASGQPLSFRSGYCNLPGQFAAGCIPGVLPGASIWAQEKGSYDVSKPIFNVAAFEPASNFNFYFGRGSRTTNYRGFGYHNQDFGLEKDTQFGEKVRFLLRVEAFNVWNWHIFTSANGGGFANTDISSPSFGMWNGAVTAPRNIQIGGKVTF